MKQGILYGVGIGPGDPELLTFKAVRVLQECPVIACPQTEGEKNLALDIVKSAVPLEGKRVLYLPFSMRGNREEREKAHRQTAGLLLSELHAGRDVAMITLGDVTLYSTFGHLEPFVRESGCETRMIPGVPSFCAVAARLGISLTEGCQQLHVLPVGHAGWEDGLSQPGAKVLMKAGKDLQGLAETLRGRGLLEQAALIQNCGLSDEVICRDLSGELPKTGYFTTVVIPEEKGNKR